MFAASLIYFALLLFARVQEMLSDFRRVPEQQLLPRYCQWCPLIETPALSCEMAGCGQPEGKQLRKDRLLLGRICEMRVANMPRLHK